jgi:outer membrane protein assembly factor BamD (BamD/ComL family)
MNQLQYLDFELVLEKEGPSYRARVIRSPVGEASHVFDLPISDLELENFVLRLEVTRRGTRRISSPEMQHARQFGSKLFEAVFRGDVRASFVSSQHEAERRGLGLRLKLRLDSPELINVPWEYLYDASLGRFLSLFEDTPIVRYMDMRGSIMPLSVNQPLSMLVMISRPSDHQTLGVEREQANLQSALGELVKAGMLTMTFVEKATLPALADSLLRGRYHVFHYIGHGGFDERSQDGVLVLEDEGGRSCLTSGERLAVLLGNHPTLRLVLLNTCEGARTSSDDPFAGTATALVRTGGLPAVVAMQSTITDEAAITFTRGFYTALSVGRPVDSAMSHARLAIFADGNDIEWGKPVLYMRAPDGRIFDVESLTPEVLAARRRAAEAARAEREATERRAREQHQARLEELYQRATTLLAQREWAGAQEVLATLQELEPGYRDVAALVEQARSGVREQERCAALYGAAQKDLEAGRLPEAMAGFRSVLDLDASHDGAARLLAEAQAQVERQEAEERLAQLYAQAEEAYSHAAWKRAGMLYKQVLALKPEYRDTVARRAEALHQQQLATLYSQAWAHLKARRWHEAIEGFEALVEAEPGYGHPAHGSAAALLAKARQEKERAALPTPPAGPPEGMERRKKPTAQPGREVERRLEQRYTAGLAAFWLEKWDEACDHFQAIVDERPGYQDAADKLAKARRQKRWGELYAQAQAARKAETWDAALSALEELVAENPEYRDAAALLAEARQEKERAGLPAPPAGKRPRPTGLPEEIKRRDKPKDRPA